MRGVEVWLLEYLLNGLWQVPLVFAAAWVLARAVRPLGVAEEHRMWCSALVLAGLLPLGTMYAHALLDEARSRLTSWFAGGPSAGASVTVTMGDGQAGRGLHVPSGWPEAVLGLYALVVAYSIARMAWGLWQTQRLRRRATAVALDTPVGAAWFRYAKIFGVLADEIATVPDVPGPMTVGVLRRVLLLPESWVGDAERVAPEDLDAAIAHECAHMQRRDFAKNLLYRLLALPVSWHPVVWLMQSRVTETREMVCDAMAADAVAGRERYARSLLRLATELVDCGRGQTLHAIGIFDANNFERRVMELTMKRTDAGKMRRLAIKAVCVVLGCGTAVSALALRMQVATPVVASAQQSEPLPMAMVVAVPKPATGEPVKSFKIDVQPTVAASAHAAPVPMRVKVLTPAVVEPEQSAIAGVAPRVPADVMAGNILSKVAPVYPQAAKDARVQGEVVLHAIIAKDGTMKSLAVVSGPQELQMSAMEAVRQWTYRPYLLNGQPTEVDTTITVHYNMNGY